jgi:hypothetical protein
MLKQKQKTPDTFCFPFGGTKATGVGESVLG